MGLKLRRLKSHLRSLAALSTWDLRYRAQASVLGLGWTVLSPLMRILIFYGVFFHILGVNAPSAYAHRGPGLWIAAGMLPWLWIADTLGRAPSLVLERGSSYRNGAFPGQLLAPMNLISAWAYHACGLGVLWLLLKWSGAKPSWAALGCLPWMFVAGLLALGLSWIAAALNVFWRDTAQIMAIFLNAWVYASPIAYPRELAPAGFQPVLEMNPMTHIVEGYRAAWLGNAPALWHGLPSTLTVAVIAALAGYAFFVRLQPVFAEEL